MSPATDPDPPRSGRVNNPELAAVAEHYGRNILNYELDRLARHAPAEAGITRRLLARYIPDHSVVADVGCGSGVYSELLARRGCALHMVDISADLLAAATARLRGHGLLGKILGSGISSATNLRDIPSGSCDAALLLGPLYHLRNPADRRKALEEAHRILKPGGILCAAGINRMAFLRDLLRDRPGDGRALRDACINFLQHGNVDPQSAPPIGHAHLTTVAELRSLCSERFAELTMVGVDAFASPYQDRLSEIRPEDQDGWLDVLEVAGSTAEGLACADHFLFVGRRP